MPYLALVADRPAADGGVGGSVDPRIMAALLRLPARQRQVVALRLFLDLDTAHTAQVLGIAPGTVQAHLGRAMAALRDDLIPTRQAGWRRTFRHDSHALANASATWSSASCALPVLATTALRHGSQLAWKNSANSVFSRLTIL